MVIHTHVLVVFWLMCMRSVYIRAHYLCTHVENVLIYSIYIFVADSQIIQVWQNNFCNNHSKATFHLSAYQVLKPNVHPL